MKLYTALGMCKDVKTPQGSCPIISVGEKAYRPTAPEMIIWTLLLWNVRPFDELQSAYDDMMESHHISEEVSFEWFLQHMENEGVVASGEDVDLINTCYDLFKNLVIIVPAHLSFLQKAVGFIREVVWYRCPVNIALVIFRKPRYPAFHQQIIDVAGKNRVTTAELVRYFELGGQGSLFEMVYKAGADFATVGRQSCFDAMKIATLTAVVELFNNREITLINR